MSAENFERLRVVCAANINSRGFVVLGARHFDSCMHETIRALGLEDEDWQQGFITNMGNWVDRKEAWIIADRAGQIIRRVGGDTQKLYSENLY